MVTYKLLSTWVCLAYLTEYSFHHLLEHDPSPASFPFSYPLLNYSAYFPLWKQLEPSALTLLIYEVSVYSIEPISVLKEKKRKKKGGICDPVNDKRTQLTTAKLPSALINFSQEKGAFKAFWSRGKYVLLYELQAKFFAFIVCLFFFCTHSQAWIIYSSSGRFRVILLPSNSSLF